MTGASGFLGRHVLHALQRRSVPALALVRDIGAWNRMEWTRGLRGVTPVAGGLDEPAGWADRALPAQLGGVLHLAALVRHSRKNAAEVYAANVDGTLAMVRVAAARNCRLVYVSTSGVVGCFREPNRRADEDAPYCEEVVARWPYYHSKIVAERRARALAAELGAGLVIVRPPVLLGPGDHRLRSTGHLIRFLRGRLPFMIRGGMHFADVRDAAEAIVRALEHPAPRPIYHLTGTICSIEEFFALAGEVSGVRPPRWKVPVRLAWLAAAALRPFGVLPDPVVVENAAHHWGTSSRYAEPDLGYASRPASETMRDSIQWLRGQGVVA